MPEDPSKCLNEVDPWGSLERGGSHLDAHRVDPEADPFKGFETTQWTVVLKAGQAESAERMAALESLCRIYWEPVYAYLRRQGKSPHDAEDHTQAFFLHVLTKDVLRELSPRKGRFRSYLLVVLKHFVINCAHHDQAAKRGGTAALIPLETARAEQNLLQGACRAYTAEQCFDRRWALTVLDRALVKLRREAEQAGTRRRFEQIERFLSMEGDRDDYAAAGVQLGLSPDAVKVAVHRLRQRYGLLVRAEVTATVSRFGDAEDEIRYLLGLLSQ